MQQRIVTIGLIGGGPYCVEILDKYVLGSSNTIHNTRIVAVVEKDESSLGVIKAKELGISVLKNYQDLYDLKYGIQLIIVLSNESGLLEAIIKSHPVQIRILSFEVFKFLWHDIGVIEDKLDRQTKEMATILNHIQDYIVVISPVLDIVNANQSFLTYMNLSWDDVIGHKCYDILHKKSHFCDICHSYCPIKDIIKNKLSSRRVQYAQIIREGKVHYLDDIIYPVWDNDGNPSGFIKIGRDITELKEEQQKTTLHLEELVKERTKELRDTNAIVLHQDKMTSLGKLSAAVVHEINNPIAGILNLIALMKRIKGEESAKGKGGRGENPDQFESYLNLMESETRRISRIVSNLLAFSRQSREELNRFDFNDLVEKALIMNSNLIKLNHIQVEKNLAAQMPRLLGSEDPLEQVLMNLMSNAIEAMENLDKKQMRIETKYSLAENRIYFTISDTGSGIPEEFYPKLYEPFFTTKKKGKGIGLGLSLVYGIIQKHHGRLTFTSKVNEGTTFQFGLPVDNIAEEMTMLGR